MISTYRPERSLAILLVLTSACFQPAEQTEPEPAPTVAPLGQVPGHGRAGPYQPCGADNVCPDGMECVSVLGASFCTVTGCADGSACPGSAMCLVSEAVDPRGVCTTLGGDPYCARHCRDVLTCNLDVECNTRGCCTNLDPNGCPATCTSMEAMSCEVSPQCPIECCYTRPQGRSRAAYIKKMRRAAGR